MIRRRIHRRTTTIERIAWTPERRVGMAGESFRIEISNGSDESVYVCEIVGEIEVTESPNGEVLIVGRKACLDEK